MNIEEMPIIIDTSIENYRFDDFKYYLEGIPDEKFVNYLAKNHFVKCETDNKYYDSYIGNIKGAFNEIQYPKKDRFNSSDIGLGRINFIKYFANLFGQTDLHVLYEIDESINKNAVLLKIFSTLLNLLSSIKGVDDTDIISIRDTVSDDQKFRNIWGNINPQNIINWLLQHDYHRGKKSMEIGSVQVYIKHKSSVLVQCDNNSTDYPYFAYRTICDIAREYNISEAEVYLLILYGDIFIDIINIENV